MLRLVFNREKAQKLTTRPRLIGRSISISFLVSLPIPTDFNPLAGSE